MMDRVAGDGRPPHRRSQPFGRYSEGHIEHRQAFLNRLSYSAALLVAVVFGFVGALVAISNVHRSRHALNADTIRAVFFETACLAGAAGDEVGAFRRRQSDDG